MEVLGSSIDLCSFTRESWHGFWKVYIADPKMDPNTPIPWGQTIQCSMS